ncbi:hypothetical protein CMI46_02295 [Candidatus Pacearchaeota archaeon]|nr:hypothetical protein [Candidatus Pacearchaeota archaeon]|tara:strand:+ start:14109 stop:14324 length:216 start_codon:yes stop_codon:yes gene_type:complete
MSVHIKEISTGKYYVGEEPIMRGDRVVLQAVFGKEKNAVDYLERGAAQVYIDRGRVLAVYHPSELEVVERA